MDTVSEPVEAHVNGLGAFLLDCVSEDTLGSCIVSLDGCGRLRVAEFFKGLAKGAGILGIDEGCPNFGFCSRGKDVAHDLDKDVDGGIDEHGVSVCIAKEMIASSSGSCHRGREIGGISVCAEDHGTSFVLEGGFRM